MNRLLVIILMILAVFPSQADTRRWDEGPLKWADFTGNPEIRTTPTRFKGVLKLETSVREDVKNPLNTEVSYTVRALALMDKDMSYMDSTVISPQLLRYHQLQFDLLEVMRRRLQADLNSGMEGIEADNRVAYYQRLYDEQIADIARLTVNGSNDSRLQDYEYMVRKQLEEYMRPAVSRVKPGPWHGGWFVGTGVLIPTGEISDYFADAWLFNIGLSGGYRRWVVKADISYGQPDIKRRDADLFGRQLAAGRKYMTTDEYAKQLSGSVSLGFRVVDAKRFAVTPYVGGGWTNMSWNYAEFAYDNAKDEYIIDSSINKDSFSNFNIMGGIDFDWRFHTSVSEKSHFLSNRREQYTSSLRLTPYVIYQKYTTLVPERTGLFVGINLTYSGFLRALRIE